MVWVKPPESAFVAFHLFIFTERPTDWDASPASFPQSFSCSSSCSYFSIPSAPLERTPLHSLAGLFPEARNAIGRESRQRSRTRTIEEGGRRGPDPIFLPALTIAAGSRNCGAADLVQALGRSHPGNPGVGRSLALPSRGNPIHSGFCNF
jgi:hypothetical protein